MTKEQFAAAQQRVGAALEKLLASTPRSIPPGKVGLAQDFVGMIVWVASHGDTADAAELAGAALAFAHSGGFELEDES